MSSLDPNRKKREDTKKASSDKLTKLGHKLKTLDLNEYEETISTELILASDIPVDFKSIGGLDGIISSLQESVIAPLCYPELFSSASGLLGAPKGVLLYGPPGTGKTLLAKALAKESGATFINMHVSTLTNKWFGESNKLVAALFSLARKLQPCIIFIDEIDSFLRERASGDHEVTAMMKAEFMTLWDGLTSSSDRILVLGATNRPDDIDSAILRRMPKRYAVKLPDANQRARILEIMLNKVERDSSFSMSQLVAKTEGCSGSDLKEVCRAAAMVPVRELLRANPSRFTGAAAKAEAAAAAAGADTPTTPTVPALPGLKPRPLRNSDFFQIESASQIHHSHANGRARNPKSLPQEGLD
ncbi:mitochondrial dynamin GTPase Msp1 [Tilletia horrida]|uniref:Mitochondrial dynamin GTPase Msp1 n=1 Tax=Tilletia horrida TaxID=155126 RepID=A0AAN6GU70_9BASI|nr:mitochondrial dynamin GTPase Msp1 [Tilletia horrida]